MTNIEDLLLRLKILSELLEKPEPGLFAWRESYESASANVLAFWGYGIANVSLLPEQRPLTAAEQSNLAHVYGKLRHATPPPSAQHPRIEPEEISTKETA